MSNSSFRHRIAELTPLQRILWFSVILVVGFSVLGAAENGVVGAFRTALMVAAFETGMFLILLGLTIVGSEWRTRPNDRELSVVVGGSFGALGLAVALFGFSFCSEQTIAGQVAVRSDQNGRYTVISSGDDIWHLAPPWYPQECIHFGAVGFNAKLQQKSLTGEVYEVRIWLEATPNPMQLDEYLAEGRNPSEFSTLQSVSDVAQRTISGILSEAASAFDMSTEELSRKSTPMVDAELRQRALLPKFFRIVSVEKVSSG